MIMPSLDLFKIMYTQYQTYVIIKDRLTDETLNLKLKDKINKILL